MLTVHSRLCTFILLALIPAALAKAQSEAQRDFMAQVASVSPKGVAAGMATINGVSMPILAFLNETSLPAFKSKLQAKFEKTHILVPQKTGSAEGFLLVPQKKYPCATCRAEQLSTLANTIKTATSFSWIDTPDIHIAYATPLSSIAASAFSTDKTLSTELEKLLPGASVIHTESLSWANASTATLLAELPLSAAEAIVFWRTTYEKKGWTVSATSSTAVILRKDQALARLTFEPLTTHTVRMSRYEVSQR